MALVSGRSPLLSFNEEVTFKQALAQGTRFKRQDFQPGGLTRWGGQTTEALAESQSQDRLTHGGIITGITAGLGFNLDYNFQLLHDWWAAANSTLRGGALRLAVTSISTTTVSFAALTAGQEIPEDALVLITGANGDTQVRTVTGAASTGDTSITVGTAVTIQAAGATVEVAGLSFDSAVPTWSYSAGVGMLTFTADHNLAEMGLEVGQRVMFGGLNTAASWPEASFTAPGYGTVSSISSRTVTFRNLSGGAANNMKQALTFRTGSEMRFSDFWRQYPIGDPGYDNKSYQFELFFPDHRGPGLHNYEFIEGSALNNVNIAFPLRGKVTASMVFEAANESIDNNYSRSAASATPGNLGQYDDILYEALATTNNYSELSLERADGTAVSARVDNWNLSVGQSVSPRFFQGDFSADFMNRGNHTFAVGGQLSYEDPAYKQLVRDSTQVVWLAGVPTADAVVFYQMPTMTMSNNAITLPQDDVVLIGLTGNAHGDGEDIYGFNSSLMTSSVRHYN